MFYVVYLTDAEVFLVIPCKWLRDGAGYVLEKFVDKGLNSNQKHLCYWSRHTDAVVKNRRSYKPPIYNIRRIYEAPVPNVEAAVVTEMDIDAESAIQNAIENIEVFAEMNYDKGVALAKVKGMADGGEVVAVIPQLNNVSEMADGENDIEHIKLETPVLVLHGNDVEDFDLLLLDESDPLENTSNTFDETLTTNDLIGNDTIDEDDEPHAEPISPNNNLLQSNHIGVASVSGLHQRTIVAVTTPVATFDSDDSDDDDQPNITYPNRNATDDDEVIFMLPNKCVFPLPIPPTTNHNLVKREADRLSGDIAYRNDVINCIYIITTTLKILKYC